MLRKDCIRLLRLSGLASVFNVYIGEYRKAADSTAKAALEPTEFTTTVTSDGSTPIEGATVVYRLTGSTVERYKGTTDSNGEASGALCRRWKELRPLRDGRRVRDVLRGRVDTGADNENNNDDGSVIPKFFFPLIF